MTGIVRKGEKVGFVVSYHSSRFFMPKIFNFMFLFASVSAIYFMCIVSRYRIICYIYTKGLFRIQGASR